MSASEWQTCTDVSRMERVVERRGDTRKLILYGVACCRRAQALSTHPDHRALVDAAERHADGEISRTAFETAIQAVDALFPTDDEYERTPFLWMSLATYSLRKRSTALDAGYKVARGLASLQGEKDSPAWLAAMQAEAAFQCSLLREIFGDPSRPFEFNPAWLAGEGKHAVELARAIDQERRFGEIPKLGEALEQAGCHDQAVLDHCRVAEGHGHGCWVLDALLGREPAVCRGLTTEADWNALEDPTSLLAFLHDRGTEQQWRLFAVACCRRIEQFMFDPRSRRAVDVAERYARGLASTNELEEARAAAQEAQVEAKRLEYSTEADEGFCITPRYAEVSRCLFAAEAARSSVNRDSRVPDAAPGTNQADWWKPAGDWAVATVRWDVYARMAEEDVGQASWDSVESLVESISLSEHGKLSTGRPRNSVERAANRAGADEMRAQCQILRDIFSDLLGPPSEAGAWLPTGGALPVVCRGLTSATDWNTLEDPASLLAFLHDRGTEKQWRLFAVACCRRIEQFMVDPRSRQVVDVAEQYAKGVATPEAFELARVEAQQALDEARHAAFQAEAEENFGLTARNAGFTRNLFAARAARGTLNRDPRLTDDEPGTFEARRWRPTSAWAAATVGRDAFQMVMESLADKEDTDAAIETEDGIPNLNRPFLRAKEAGDRARSAEERVQNQILLDHFSNLLVPSGEAGAGLPTGEVVPVAEWWCLLPTVRALDAGPR